MKISKSQATKYVYTRFVNTIGIKNEIIKGNSFTLNVNSITDEIRLTEGYGINTNRPLSYITLRVTNATILSGSLTKSRLYLCTYTPPTVLYIFNVVLLFSWNYFK